MPSLAPMKLNSNATVYQDILLYTIVWEQFVKEPHAVNKESKHA